MTGIAGVATCRLFEAQRTVGEVEPGPGQRGEGRQVRGETETV